MAVVVVMMMVVVVVVLVVVVVVVLVCSVFSVVTNDRTVLCVGEGQRELSGV